MWIDLLKMQCCVYVELKVIAQLDTGGSFEGEFVAYFVNMHSKGINFLEDIV